MSGSNPISLTNFDLPNSPEEFGLLLPPSSLKRINFTALEFETLRRAAIEYIKTYYPNEFNDFVADNSLIMVLEVVAFLSSGLALRGDVLANEATLPTSLTENAVIQHLKLINQKIKQATPSTVNVSCTISIPLISDLRIPAGSVFQVGSPDGNPLYYEIFKSPTDFSGDIVIPRGKLGVVAYGIEGITAAPLISIATGQENTQISITSDNLLEAPITVDITTESGNTEVTERWAQIDIIERADPNQKVYEVRRTETGALIVFGNGTFGTIPQSGSTITITYRTGGGSRGRIISGALDESRAIIPDSPLSAPVVVRFRNVTSSEGGFDRESISEAKRRAPLEAATHQAIVSGEDYSIIAKSYSHPVFGSVYKANAVLRSSINANQVELYVLALGADGDPVTPSLGLKEGLTNYISDLNVFTDQVLVLNGATKTIDLEMDVIISKNADPSVVKNSVETAIDDFFSSNNFEIGRGFRLSNLVNAIQDIEGIRFVRIFSPKDDILESNEKTTDVDELTVGYSELLVLGSRKVTYYLEPSSQQRIN